MDLNVDFPFEARDEIQNIVTEEVGRIFDVKSSKLIRSSLRTPTPVVLEWEYGNKEKYPAWLIADMGERDVWIAYCNYGHGERGTPWGLVFTWRNIFGTTDEWYPSLDRMFDEWLRESDSSGNENN